MKIVYYYVLYLAQTDNPEKVKIFLIPFDTRDQANKFKEEQDEKFGDRVVFSKVMKKDISKFEKGLWL